MSVQIALLRAVNVGGTGLLPMAALRKLAEDLGFGNVRTLLQSGNLIFDARRKSPAASEKLLETACAKTFGLKTDIYVRTPAELAAIIAGNPFAREARDEPGHLVVLFRREAADAGALKTLQAAIKGREIIKAAGRDVYITYPDGIGNSKLTPALIAKHLGSSGTGRNWNTVRKLAAIAAA